MMIKVFAPDNDNEATNSKTKKAEEKIETKTDNMTLTNLLRLSLQPVGHTMYVYGGGWNEEDTGSGEEALTLGISDNWYAFFEKQTSNYNYEETLYQIHDGLDCSGYIGWLVYNLIGDDTDNVGYVMKAGTMAKAFSDAGFGTYTSASQVSDYKPGDIMSSSDYAHVYMVLGNCEDGSILLVHSSPPGVRISGTPDIYGNEASQAVKLAQKWMQEQYPEWYAKYPDCLVSSDYFYYDQMRWNILKDSDNLSDMSAEEIYAFLTK